MNEENMGITGRAFGGHQAYPPVPGFGSALKGAMKEETLAAARRVHDDAVRDMRTRARARKLWYRIYWTWVCIGGLAFIGMVSWMIGSGKVLEWWSVLWNWFVG